MFSGFQQIKIHSITRQHSVVIAWKFGKAGALQCSLKLFSRLTCHGPLICGRSNLDFFLKFSGFTGIFVIITGIVSENTKLWEKNSMIKKKIKEFYNFFLKFFCCSTLGIFEVLEEFWRGPKGVKYGFLNKSFRKDEPLISWTLLQHICPHFWAWLLFIQRFIFPKWLVTKSIL